jgi:DNA integrity scanning protein DisA with diadenylate cyclase activity
MWEHQAHFRISAQTAAEGIFNLLDPNLQPNVFLVGILEDDRRGSHPLCFIPEGCGYERSLLSEVKRQARGLEGIDQEQGPFNPVDEVQNDHAPRLRLGVLRKALQEALCRQDRKRGVASFCSWPVIVRDYVVFAVLQLKRRVLESCYALAKDQLDGRYTSLLDATIHEYLDVCSEALRNPNSGSEDADFSRDPEEIVRAAGKQFMYTPALAGGEIEGLHGLFDACNMISSLRYEGAEGIGRMLIARRGHPNIREGLRLSRPIRITDYRAVRKLLEISSGESSLSLLCDSASIYGYGEFVGSYDAQREDLFVINFTKHYTWSLEHAEHVMIRVTYGHPRLSQMQIEEEKFKRDLRRIFDDLDRSKAERLWSLILEATKQKHGTTVVVSSEASKEAARLENQSIRIEPVQLTPEIMRMVTAIDGAVMIDPNATCYAIGVILDGVASQKGNAARGARYNSAIRYVDGRDGFLATVVSEDGSIDLIPDLMPQIPRSATTQAVSKLQAIRDAGIVNFEEFRKVMDWLSEHRFYLMRNVCEEVNLLRRDIEARFERDTAVRIAYDDFRPNDEMNESYFLEE